MRRTIPWLASFSLIGCVVGDGEDPAALRIDSSDDSGLSATMTVDGELVTVTTRVHDGVRDIAITGDASYAEWHMQLANLDTYGSYGGRPFGQPENASTDGDFAAWKAIASSHAGDVLQRVSTAAGDASGPADELAAVARIYPSLASLARDPSAPTPYTSGCWFGNSTYESAYCSEGEYYVYASTTRPNGDCTRDYFVQLYRDNPWTYLSGDGTRDGSWWVADVARVDIGSGFRSYSSKHWDSLNAGAPIWHDHGVTCP